MKIIIAGGRNCVLNRRHFDLLYSKLNYYYHRGEFEELVSGDCETGADVFNEIFSKLFFNKPPTKFPADWKKHGKAAGPIRNEEMAKYADACIILPGGKGTANMKMNAVRYGLKVWEI